MNNENMIQTSKGKLFLDVCNMCAIPFAYPEDLYYMLKRTKQDFTCPNNHRQHFVDEPHDIAKTQKIKDLESEIERLRKLLPKSKNKKNV